MSGWLPGRARSNRRVHAGTHAHTHTHTRKHGISAGNADVVRWQWPPRQYTQYTQKQANEKYKHVHVHTNHWQIAI